MNCRLCESDKLKLYFTTGYNNEFIFYRCSNCGLVNLDLSKGLDQQKYTEVYQDPFIESHKINKDQKDTARFLINRLPSKGKYLDIGCGNGKLLWLMKQDGWVVKGLELSDFYAQKIKETLDIEVEVANFLDYENTTTTYDLISLRHVLEHLPYPLVALQQINRLLNQGGYAILEFPNIESFEARLRRFKERTNIYKRSFASGWMPGHCNEYSLQPFKLLLEKTGFDLVEWQTYSSSSWKNLLFNHIKIGSKARALIRKK